FFVSMRSRSDFSLGLELATLAVAIPVAAVCALYFIQSKRVRATFVEPSRRDASNRNAGGLAAALTHAPHASRACTDFPLQIADDVRDGANACCCSVGNGNVELLFKGQDQLDAIKRIRSEIVLQVGLRGDSLGRDAELLDNDLLDPFGTIR